MGFEGGVLDALEVAGDGDGGMGGGVGGGVGGGEGGAGVAAACVDVRDQVAGGVGDAAGRLVVQNWGAGAEGVGGVEDGGEEVVFDVEGAGARFGGALVRGDDGGDTLADEADGVVEQAGVVGIGAGVFVAGGGEQAGGERPRE